jgi:integrase
MNTESLLDVACRRRSLATLPGYMLAVRRATRACTTQRTPRIEEIVAVMRAAGRGANGDRLRGLLVVLWRGGLRIADALELGEADLDERAGTVLIRRGKGGKAPPGRHGRLGLGPAAARWLEHRHALPVGRLFCVIRTDPRTALDRECRPYAAAPRRGPGRRAAPLRAAPAAASVQLVRARCRAGALRCGGRS